MSPDPSVYYECTIRGKVTNASGVPISGAIVKWDRGSHFERIAKTGKSGGRYKGKIGPIPPDPSEQTLQARHPIHGVQTKTVAGCSPNTVIVVAFELV